jgi:hypothetical protein
MRPARHAPPLETSCRNCGTQVTDAYCPRCGQGAHDHAKSIAHLVEELLEGFLHFDSRFMRTVKALFLAPGRMTADYNAGKRAGYVPPVRLYLFVSVLFFVTLAMTHVGLVAIAWRPPMPDNEMTELVEHDDPTDDHDDEPVTPEVQTNRRVRSWFAKRKAIPDFRFFVDLEHWKQADKEAADALVASAEESEAPGWIKRLAHGVASGSEHTEEFSHRFSSYLSKLMFVMMPLFALMLAAVYWRQRRYFSEHFTFSLHFHSFVFIALVLVAIGQKLAGKPLSGHPEVAALLVLGFGLYLLLSMKQAYGQGWIRTPIKFMLVSTAYFVLFALSFVAVLVWSLPGVS